MGILRKLPFEGHYILLPLSFCTFSLLYPLNLNFTLWFLPQKFCFCVHLKGIYFVVYARILTYNYKSSGTRWRNGYRIL